MNDLPEVDPHARSRNLALIDQHQQHLRGTIARHVNPDRPVALLDFPAYGNPGDAAIWLGARQLLAGHDIRYVSSIERLSIPILRHRVGDGTIVLSGGGNFGDIYEKFQPFRERIAAAFPRNPIVQLPQTVKFSTPRALRESGRRLGPNFTLLVRDTNSLHHAQGGFPVVEMAPDCAFMLGQLDSTEPPRVPVQVVARVDPERHHDRPDRQPGTVDVDDWYTGLFHTRGWQARYAAATVASTIRPCLDPLAREVFDHGVRMLSQGSTVVTDRLHAHILAVLMGKPHVVLDNTYGKNSSFVAAWTADAAGVHVADSMDEAVSIALEQAVALIA